MAGGPPSDPNNTNPMGQPPTVDPALIAAFQEMASASKASKEFAKEVRDMMADSAKHAKDLTKNLDKEKLSFIVGLFDEVENKLAEINRFTKKFVHEIHNIKDTKAAKEQIEDMVRAMRDALASQKSFSAGAGAIRRSIAGWEKELTKFGDDVRELTEGEMKDLTMLAERTAKAGKDFSSSMKKSEIGKLGDFLKGATAATKPGYVGDLKERWGSMKEAFEAPRLARKAMGAAEGVEGAEGAAGAGSMIEGAMGMVVDAIEGGVEALEIGMEALSGPLGWLVIGIEALIAIFEKYVKQNKDMESKLGKGGLFTGNAMLDAAGGTTFGVEDAFSRTRRALNPRGSGYNELGISWQRNLDIAGGLAGSGYGIKGMFEGGDYANARGTTTGVEGLTSGFAGGGFGQVQRMVTGVGRVLGMTDTEGVGEVLKMLEQYSQTLDSTEKFLAQIDKDTSAAGISTTKYLKIIDDVSSHFNKMNKEINQTLGIMRELGRSGAISSEVLKDMMEFLTTEAKPDVGGIADDIYAQSQQTKETRKAATAASDKGVQDALDSARSQVADMDKKTEGGTGIMIPQINLGEGTKADFANATGQIDKLETDIKIAVRDKKISDVQGQQLDQVAQGLRKALTVAGVSRTGAYGRAAGRAAGFTSPAEVAASNLTKVQSSMSSFGIKASDVASGAAFGPGGNPDAAIGMQMVLGQIMHMDPAQALQEFQTTMSERATNLTTGADDQAKKDAQALTKEVFTKWKAKGAVPNWAKERGYTLDALDGINGTLENNAKFLSKNSDKMVGELEDTNGLQTQIIQHAADQHDITSTELNLEVDKARKIGRQTQSMADMVGGVFSKWLTKIISWLEYIGHAIGWIVQQASAWTFGTFESQQKDRDKTAASLQGDISDDLKSIPAKLEEVNKDQLKLEEKNKGLPSSQWSQADQDQYKKLDEIGHTLEETNNTLSGDVDTKGKVHFGSQDDLDDATASLADFNKAMGDLHAITPASTAAVAGTAAGAAAGTSGPTHVDNSKTEYNVGTVKQNFSKKNTVGSADENSPPPRQVPVGRGDY